jgi:hypothetical protein
LLLLWVRKDHKKKSDLVANQLMRT